MEMYGERLKIRRRARGLTQKALGKLIGVSSNSIRIYEQFERESNTYVGNKIAEYLGEF